MEQWTTRRIIFLTFTVGIVLYLVYYVPGVIGHFLGRVWDVVVVLVLATALAVLLSPPVAFLSQFGAPVPLKVRRALATIIVLVVLIALLWGLVSLTATQLVQESQGILAISKQWLSQAPQQVQQWLNAHRADFPPGVVDKAAEAVAQLTQGLLQYQFNFAKFALLRGWFVVELLIVPVLAFYFLIDSRPLRDGTLSFTPRRYRVFVAAVLDDVGSLLHSYVRAQALLCLITAVAVGLILRMAGVKMYLTLGLLAGVFRVAPIVGPICAGIFCVGVPLIQNGLHTGLVVLLFYWLLFLVDGKLLTPLLLAGSAMLHPVVAIVSLLIGYEFLGVLGLLTAIPAAGTLRAIFLRYQEQFGEKTEEQLEPVG